MRALCHKYLCCWLHCRARHQSSLALRVIVRVCWRNTMHQSEIIEDNHVAWLPVDFDDILCCRRSKEHLEKVHRLLPRQCTADTTVVIFLLQMVETHRVHHNIFVIAGFISLNETIREWHFVFPIFIMRIFPHALIEHLKFILLLMRARRR